MTSLSQRRNVEISRILNEEAEKKQDIGRRLMALCAPCAVATLARFVATHQDMGVVVTNGIVELPRPALTTYVMRRCLEEYGIPPSGIILWREENDHIRFEMEPPAIVRLRALVPQALIEYPQFERRGPCVLGLKATISTTKFGEGILCGLQATGMEIRGINFNNWHMFNMCRAWGQSRPHHDIRDDLRRIPPPQILRPALSEARP